MLFNNTSKIINNKDLLSIDCVPQRIIGRDEEIKELIFHLAYIFREHPSIPTQFVFGGTGTGKTTVILYLLKKVEQEMQQQVEEKKLNIRLKVVRLKGSETKTKYEVLKKILTQISPDIESSSNSSDLHSKIIKTIAERGYYVLIFFDEVDELKDNELNGVLYTISRLGQDIAFAEVKSIEKLEKIEKGNIGYILVSNDATIRGRLKENTRSSLTREAIVFERYTPEQLVEILKSRIEDGAIYKDKIEDGVLEFIASVSIKEGQDARYGLTLLSNVAKESEKRSLPKINIELTKEVNQVLLQDYLKQLLRDLPDLSMEILLIIYELNQREEKINSKTIWEVYQGRPYVAKVTFSRISQIVTDLEKERIVYVSQSKKTKLRNISIEENITEIEEILKERGKL